MDVKLTKPNVRKYELKNSKTYIKKFEKQLFLLQKKVSYLIDNLLQG